MLAAKLLLVGAMISLAIVNRYALVPRVAARRAGAMSALQMATGVEIILGLGVIGLVSVFGMLEPI
jgi:putative copper resistance protein D